MHYRVVLIRPGQPVHLAIRNADTGGVLWRAPTLGVAPTPRPPDAWRVSLIRPFAIGKLTGMGWLYAQEGHIVVQGGWPFPGPSFLVTHTECDVEIQLSRLMVPWIGVDAILHDDDQAVVVCVPRWNRQRLFSLLQANGFTPHARWVWHSTATRRARKWLLHEPATP